MGRKHGAEAPKHPSVAGLDDGPLVERVDRYILVVTARQPLVDWMRALEELDGVEEGDVRFSLKEARAIPSTYLVPYSFDPDPAVAWITENCEMIFETELESLEPDPALWPQDRSPKVFESWFDLELLDAPLDLVDGPFYLSALPVDESDHEVPGPDEGPA